jgi:hypothetical protein
MSAPSHRSQNSTDPSNAWGKNAHRQASVSVRGFFIGEIRTEDLKTTMNPRTVVVGGGLQVWDGNFWRYITNITLSVSEATIWHVTGPQGSPYGKIKFAL